MLNTKAAGDVRKARSGKDAMLYTSKGSPYARVESFVTQSNFNNYKYAPLGQNRELETAGTVAVTIQISEIVVTDGTLFNRVIQSINEGIPVLSTFKGVIEGENGTEERVVYRKCIFSGTNDIQNVSTGDVLKRAFNLHCNGAVELEEQIKY